MYHAKEHNTNDHTRADNSSLLSFYSDDISLRKYVTSKLHKPTPITENLNDSSQSLLSSQYHLISVHTLQNWLQMKVDFIPVELLEYLHC